MGPEANGGDAKIPQLKDVATDQLNSGLQEHIVIDRDTASRLGMSPLLIDSTLSDAFGQRQVSTTYGSVNQYHVLMEVAPRFQTDPDSLKNIYVKSTAGAMVPLTSVTHFESQRVPLAVNHQNQVPAVTLSFNLTLGASLSEATGRNTSFNVEMSVIAMIGIILLIGIVKKNAIMMIDFALVAERQRGKAPQEAIFEACMLRFRPIMMTTMAALLGGLLLAFGTGVGSELRRPLGITIVGGFGGLPGVDSIGLLVLRPAAVKAQARLQTVGIIAIATRFPANLRLS